MATLLASLHRAHVARLKRLGALSPVIQPRICEPVAPPEPKPPPSLPSAPGFPRIHTLQACVAHAFNVRTEALAGPDRGRGIVLSRHAVMYLARELLHASFGEIGRRLGDRDHTTARNGYRQAQALMIIDEVFRERVQRAREEFLAITTVVTGLPWYQGGCRRAVEQTKNDAGVAHDPRRLR